jgi:signal transduction histidine kinase
VEDLTFSDARISTSAVSDSLRELLIHDLRTPLATISGYAQLLRRRVAEEQGGAGSIELLEGLRRIDEASRRAGLLLDGFDNVIRRSEGDVRDGLRSGLDLVALATRAAAQLNGPGRDRIVVLPSITDLVGRWERAPLECVVSNLVGNALKYSSHERDVLVTVNRSEDWAILKVADQGIGIPPAELNRVFERGYRASNVTGRFPGTGLGLSGVRQIVTGLGGTVSIESGLGVGTSVTVRLPLTPTV